MSASDTESATPQGEGDAVLTIPNLITLMRLLCLPLFLYLLFARDERAAAAWLLAGLGATDWVDGYLARRLGQTSEFGKIFDPTVDRLLFFVAIVSIIIDGSAPLWFCIVVLVRELLIAAAVTVATFAFSMRRFDVTWLGKTATFLLMAAFPGFMLGSSNFPGAEGFEIAAWIAGVPGLILSYYTAIAYIPLIRDGIRVGRAKQQVA